MSRQSILVTGGAGFIASHVVIKLVEDYSDRYDVVVLDKLDYCSCLFMHDGIKHRSNYRFILGDILSFDLVLHILKTYNIHIILHFAAQTHVDNSFGNSFQFTKNNVMGTHVLLETSKVYGRISLFLHVSTDEVYGPSSATASGMDASSLLAPTNPYAATKAAAEYLVRAYHKSFHLPCIITRGNNVYGPGQYPEKLIPKVIMQLSQGMKVTLHGDGSNKRTYVYVKDVADAFICVMLKGIVGEIYNIGSEEEHSNLQVTRTILKAMGKASNSSSDEKQFIQFVDDRPFNDYRYHINCEKIASLGWAPQTQWEDGIRQTIEWYRENGRKFGDISSVLVPHPRINAFTTFSSSSL